MSEHFVFNNQWSSFEGIVRWLKSLVGSSGQDGVIGLHELGARKVTRIVDWQLLPRMDGYFVIARVEVGPPPQQEDNS